MRAFSAAEQAIWLAPTRGARLRVSIRDAGGAFRDLTTYPEMDFVRGATWSESIDDNGSSCTVTLQRALGDRSLAPLHTTSPLNRAFNPANSFAALLGLGREIKVEAGVTPDGDTTPGTWLEVFRGFVDAIDWPGDEITLECVGLEAQLRDAWIERERVYAYAQGAGATKGVRAFELGMSVNAGDLVIPSQANLNGHFYLAFSSVPLSSTAEPTWPTGSGASVASGSNLLYESGATSTTVGTAVETVIQQILNDCLGAGVVTLRTPVSPGWAIRYYLQQRGSVMEAIRALADQIGWFCRFAWSTPDNAFRLTLFDPGRTKTTPDWSFPPEEILKPEKCRLELTAIRNVIRVIYPDSTNKDPKGFPLRTVLEVTDAASVTKYGRRFMEIAEGSASNIDTASEATTLANAVLSDLKDPTAEYDVTVRFFPWAQLGDLYAFPADGLHFTAQQNLAVTSIEHSIMNGKASTKLSTRGKPSTGLGRWLEMDARGNTKDTHQLALAGSGYTPVLTFDNSAIGGVNLQWSQPPSSGQQMPGNFEVHISPTPGFTPSSATMAGTVSSQGSAAFTVAALSPGNTYYSKLVPYGWNGEEHVRGLPGPEQSFTAGQAKAGHYDSTCTQSHLPLNGNFEHSSRPIASQPPDQWELDTSGGEVWGSSGSVFWGTDATKGRFISLRAHASLRGSLVSRPFEVRRGVRALNINLSVRRQVGSGSGSPYDLIVDVFGFSDAALTTQIVNYSVFLSGSASGPYPTLNTWYDTFIDFGGGFGALPANVNFLQIRVRRSTAGSTLVSWDIGDVYVQEADFVRATIDNLTVGAIAPVAWTAPTFANSWANYNSATHIPAGYRKTAFGDVELRGMIASGTVGAGTPAFTLPAGFRPTKFTNFVVITSTGAGRVEVDSSGGVTVLTGGNAFVSLDGLKFSLL